MRAGAWSWWTGGCRREDAGCETVPFLAGAGLRGAAVILRLVWRSLARKPGRSLLLLAGYALGIGVTVTLLSIGGALLESSRDRALVGGGDLTVLPEGLDLETFRTGGVSSLYFTIDQAPYLYRQVLAGDRFRDVVEAAAPWMDDQLVYLEHGGRQRAVTADGTMPGRADALGVAPRLLEGRWDDLPADRRWLSPSDSSLYAGIDAFHRPPPGATGDSTWAEWHYFNVLLPDGAGWLYLTYMVAGDVPDGRWGGRMLATLVDRVGTGGAAGEGGDGRGAPPAGGTGTAERRRWQVRTFRIDVPARAVSFSTERPDLAVGASTVELGSGGSYRLRATVPRASEPTEDAGDGGGGDAPGRPAPVAADTLRLELRLEPGARRYLPPLEVAGGAFPSGYTVPVLRGRVDGRLCVGDACRRLDGARGYHDHNWGVWRDVTWDWGVAHAGPWSLVWGGVRRDGDAGPRFLLLTDSLGFAGLLPVRRIEAVAPDGATGDGGGPPPPGARAPERLRVLARRGRDSLLVEARVLHARTSGREGGTSPSAGAAGPSPPDASADRFHQMYGQVRLGGRLRGEAVAAAGRGFFETWTRAGEEERASGGG